MKKWVQVTLALAISVPASNALSANRPAKSPPAEQTTDSRATKISLPEAPKPVGNYLPFVQSGSLVFINQVALRDGKIMHPGKLGADITDQQAKEATKVAMLNVLAVLKEAVRGDFSKVKRCVQLTGYFNTVDGYADHPEVMNAASEIVVTFLGERGKHARAAIGASSLPLKSPVEIQAIFEVN